MDFVDKAYAEICDHSLFALQFAKLKNSTGDQCSHNKLATLVLIETLYRKNCHFRDRDLLHITQCRMPLKFSDAERVHNIRVSI